jgi:hypothetical protein
MRAHVSTDLKQLKEELVKAGLEVYRTRPPSEIHVAERVRLHLMDSGIRVHLTSGLSVVFTARIQRSDFPSVADEQLFARVRAAVGAQAIEHGYREEGSQTVEVKDPMDDKRVLDTWHEVTYAKAEIAHSELLDEIRWALALERYLSP